MIMKVRTMKKPKLASTIAPPKGNSKYDRTVASPGIIAKLGV
jgi:hypothetical protein